MKALAKGAQNDANESAPFVLGGRAMAVAGVGDPLAAAHSRKSPSCTRYKYTSG